MQVAPGGWRYAAVPVLLALPVLLVAPLLGLVLIGLGGAVAWFHRDPDREAAGDGVLAPADGRVSVLRQEADRVRIGVFMNLTDVHVNRAPLSGSVQTVTHTPGGHWPAFTKASERNERVTIDCGDYTVELIAGAFARRIHPYVTDGESVVRGQRIAHISFSSRGDVLLPAEISRADVLVEVGDRVRAGETVLAPYDS